MATWTDIETRTPDLAKRVRARFELHGLAVLATLRADGWPRLSGIEPLFAIDELWLGMMRRSRKGDDLRRDPRLTIHAATTDKQVTEGDAKIVGRAVEVTGEEDKAEFLARFAEKNGEAPTDTDFDLVRVDVMEVSMLSPGGDHLVIEWWTEDSGTHRLERY